ncbi:MAG: DUF4129 domain-containing protein, partial [Planctomycetota bacterium]
TPTATVSLLVLTSFLNLRRYLRQRGSDMPSDVSIAWMLGGVVLIAAILALAFLIPVPGNALANFEPPKLDSPDWLRSSQYGSGSEGVDDGNQSSAQTGGETESENTGGETGAPKGGSGGQQGGSGQSGDDQSASDSQDGSQSRGDSQSAQGGGDSSGGGQRSSDGDSSGGDSSSGDQSSSSQQSGGQRQSGQQNGGSTGGEQDSGSGDSSENGDPNAPSNESSSDSQESDSQSDPQGSQQQQQSQRGSDQRGQNESTQQSGNTRQQQSQSASQPQPQSPPFQMPQLGNLFKVLIYVLLFAVLAIFAWMNRDAIRQWFHDLMAFLSGSQPQRETSQALAAPAPQPTVPPRPFSSYRNPLDTGADAKTVVIETFAALQAWWRERGITRGEHETPEEYLKRLLSRSHQPDDVLRHLIGAYNRVVYGRGMANENDVAAARQIWNQMLGRR